MSDLQLPAGPAIRFHRKYWPKQSWDPIAHLWEDITRRSPAQIQDTVGRGQGGAAQERHRPRRGRLADRRNRVLSVADGSRTAADPRIPACHAHPPPPSGPVPVRAVAEEAKKRDRSVRIMQMAAGTCLRAEKGIRRAGLRGHLIHSVTGLS